MISSPEGIKPFRVHIPRYPADYNPLTNETTQAETSEQLPTAETTMFSNPLTVKSAEFISRYISPKTNSKQRHNMMDELSRFLNKPENADAFAQYATAMLSSIQELPEERQIPERTRKYEELMNKVQETKKITILFPGHVRADVFPLPELSSQEIPHLVFDLVNSFYEEAFPEQYKRIIPPLRSQDVRIVQDKAFDDYMRQGGKVITHSLTRVSESDIPQTPVGKAPDFAVIPFLPNMPILFKEGMLEMIREPSKRMFPKSNGNFSAIIARFLIHEGLHRAHIPRLFSSDEDGEMFNRLGTFAFTRNRFLIHKDPNLGSFYKEQMDQINGYIETIGEAFVVTNGAIVEVRAKDKDGMVRVLGQSGYDINEAIVEYLIAPATDYLYHSLVERGKADEAEAFLKVDRPGSVGSFQFQNLFSIAEEYLSKLGLHSRQEILAALCKGEIPILHGRIFSEYYT